MQKTRGTSISSVEGGENHDEETTSFFASNVYFKQLIDLVPPKAYFDVECKEILSNHNFQCEDSQVVNSRIQTAKKDAASIVITKRGEKHISKKAKLNPSQPSKTSELQQLLPQLKGAVNTELSNANLHTIDSATTADQSTRPSSKFDNKESSNSMEKEQTSQSNLPTNNCNGNLTTSVKAEAKKSKRANLEKMEAVSGLDRNTSDDGNTNLTETNSSEDASKRSSPTISHARLHPEQLREKLRARILELQHKRQKGMTPEEFLESKKLRRKESKLKLKQKRKEAKKLKLSIEKQAKNSQQKLNGVSEVKPELKASGNNNVVFSKFEFSEQAKKPKDRKAKKPKSYKELYEKVTKDKAQLEELKESNPDKAKKLAEKNAWRKAMNQSKGVKVKDDPELIKKSMKKEEKLKQRSHKKWEERTTTVVDQQQKRQDKRKKNILAKKQTKTDRKVKLAKKKGRIVSGF